MPGREEIYLLEVMLKRGRNGDWTFLYKQHSRLKIWFISNQKSQILWIKVSTIPFFENVSCLICQLNSVPAKQHSSSSYSCYLLFVSHSNLVIKLLFMFKAINSSPTSLNLWSMCYFPPHYFSCSLRCFLSLLILILTDGATKQAHAERLVLFQFTLSGAMKNMVALHRSHFVFC